MTCKIEPLTIIRDQITLNEVCITEVRYCPEEKLLYATINGGAHVEEFRGDEYDKARQMSDEELLKWVIAKLEAKAIE